MTETPDPSGLVRELRQLAEATRWEWAMSEPYTPSTDWIRIMVGCAKQTAPDRVLPPNAAREEGYEWFDRWIAAYDAEVRASEREDCDGCALLEKDVARFVAERDALAVQLDKVREWVMVNEIAPVPLDWRGLGAILEGLRK